MNPASGRPSGRVEPSRLLPAGTGSNDNGSLPPHTSFGESHRATGAYVTGLKDQLSTRDEAILRDLGRVRCLTGKQLERLHFHDLQAINRDRARRRILNRLIHLSLITPLSRRIGGVRAGSAGLVYSLDAAGRRLLQLLDHEGDASTRRPWTPGALFLNHTLAIAELFVGLREAERLGRLELSTFLAEPACWQRTASLGMIKPDAYALVAHGDVEDAWWIEVDRATESRNTLRRKLSLYLLAAQAGVTGPDDILPRVLVTVPDEQRLTAIREIITGLGPVAQRIMLVTMHDKTIEYLAEILHA
jgi:hypothetical protein